MALPGLVEKFTAAGGNFVTPVEELIQKLAECRAVVFDWDGVFNAGRKGHTSSSGFAEVDSMGTNMLRYGLWRRQGELPYTAIITGENNESAIGFAQWLVEDDKARAKGLEQAKRDMDLVRQIGGRAFSKK